MNLDKVVQAVEDILNGFPLWLRVLFLAAILAAIGYLAYIKIAPVPSESTNFALAYDKETHEFKAQDGAETLSAHIENLMRTAQSDGDRCEVGFLYLDLAHGVANPYMPSQLAVFIDGGGNTRAGCVAQLKAAATTEQSRLVDAATAAHPDSHADATAAATRAETHTAAGAASQILQVGTANGARGWVYFGEQSRPGGPIDVGRTIVESAVPTAGTSVTMARDANLRDTDDPRQRRGIVIGVIPKGSHLTLTGSPLAIEGALREGRRPSFVWAPVTLDSRAHIAGVGVIAAHQGPLPTPAAIAAPPAEIQSGKGEGQFAMFGGTVTFKRIVTFASGVRSAQTAVVVHNETPKSLFVRIEPNADCEPRSYIVGPVDPKNPTGNDYFCTDPTGRLSAFAWSVAPKT